MCKATEKIRSENCSFLKVPLQANEMDPELQKGLLNLHDIFIYS